MEYSKRSSFSWSFTGYKSEEEAKSALGAMEAWFSQTFKPDEWNVVSSLSQTPNGYRAALSAVRESQAAEDA